MTESGELPGFPLAPAADLIGRRGELDGLDLLDEFEARLPPAADPPAGTPPA